MRTAERIVGLVLVSLAFAATGAIPGLLAHSSLPWVASHHVRRVQAWWCVLPALAAAVWGLVLARSLVRSTCHQGLLLVVCRGLAIGTLAVGLTVVASELAVQVGLGVRGSGQVTLLYTPWVLFPARSKLSLVPPLAALAASLLYMTRQHAASGLVAFSRAIAERLARTIRTLVGWMARTPAAVFTLFVGAVALYPIKAILVKGVSPTIAYVVVAVQLWNLLIVLVVGIYFGRVVEPGRSPLGPFRSARVGLALGFVCGAAPVCAGVLLAVVVSALLSPGTFLHVPVLLVALLYAFQLALLQAAGGAAAGVAASLGAFGVRAPRLRRANAPGG